ncbi:unnamed protein product, partial [Polarella glacialis]
AGAILGSGSQGPLQRWSSAAWVVFAGVSLAWFQEIQLECDRGSFFQTRRANSLLSALLQWRLHLALVLALADDGTRGLVPLLLWLLPALVAHGLGHARPGHATAAASPFLRAQSSRSMARGELLDLARAAAGEVLGMAPASVPVDVSLAGGLGLDSAGALIFRDSLERHLGPGVRLPAALVFEHPTLLQLADGLSKLLSARPEAVEAVEVANPVQSSASTVVSALSLELPGAGSLEQLWERLADRVDEVVEIPLCRWDWEQHFCASDLEGATAGRHGGLLEGAELFDAGFFGLTPSEAETSDPQQRLLLGTSYRALREGGYDRATLLGAPVGVFSAISNQDWYLLSLCPSAGSSAADGLSAYAGTGVASALASNRISFALGLRGPSASVDTACSSSLIALAAAAASLRRSSPLESQRRLRESLAAGCELLLSPNSMLIRSAAGMLSMSARCKTFNVTADGYVRGEGCAAALLAADNSDGGTAGLGVMLCAAAVNQDGRSASLTAPSGRAQEEVLREALAAAGASPGEIGVVECHGTGTALGDPIEVNALRGVFDGPKDAAQADCVPLWLGAGKTNLGHLEAAAGFAGLAKAISCLQRRQVPANVHFAELSPHIDLGASRLQVPEGAPEAPAQGRRCLAGVSSFGFGGTNAHAVLQSIGPDAAAPDLWPSARSRGGKRVAMLFAGQGGMRPGVGRQLYFADAAFRKALDRCADLCLPHLSGRLRLQDLICTDWDDASTEKMTSSALHSFLVTFSLEYALAEMWRARGVVPFAVLGHSLGEFAAAVQAGVMTLEDGLKLVAARGSLIDEVCEPWAGAMAAVFAPLEQLRGALVGGEGTSSLAIAALNAPEQTATWFQEPVSKFRISAVAFLARARYWLLDEQASEGYDSSEDSSTAYTSGCSETSSEGFVFSESSTEAVTSGVITVGRKSENDLWEDYYDKLDDLPEEDWPSDSLAEVCYVYGRGLWDGPLLSMMRKTSSCGDSKIDRRLAQAALLRTFRRGLRAPENIKCCGCCCYCC